jgi:hypothetical protein
MKYKLCGFLLPLTLSDPISNINNPPSAYTPRHRNLERDLKFHVHIKQFKTKLQTTLPRIELEFSVPYHSTCSIYVQRLHFLRGFTNTC